MKQKFTLKQYRLIKGLTQAQMAEIIGIHVNTYANWEENPEKISIGKAKLIAEALGLSIDELFFEK